MKTLVCAFLYNRKELLREERGKTMFWDKVAGVYDLFENLYNKKVYRETGIQVAKLININDKVLDKTTPRLIQFHTLKNAVNPPFLGGFSIFNTVVA